MTGTDWLLVAGCLIFLAGYITAHLRAWWHRRHQPQIRVRDTFRDPD